MISNHHERVALPMMICVTLLAWAKTDQVVGNAAADAGNGHGLTAERLGEPQRIGQPIALFLGQLQAAPGLDAERRPRRVQPVREPLGWCAPGPPRRDPSLRQTKIRSPAAQGPAIALACIWVSNCSSTRSAVRRNASSRNAVRLPGEK